jgi:hypothetical protein
LSNAYSDEVGHRFRSIAAGCSRTLRPPVAVIPATP